MTTEEERSQQTTGMWSLSKSVSTSDSSGLSSTSAGEEEDGGLFVLVNGRRAKSKRTGKVFGRIAGIKRNSNVFEMTTTDGASLNLSVNELDVDCLGQEFGASVCVDNLEESLRPLWHSTPYRPRTIQRQQRKRQKSSAKSTTNSEQKYKGCIQIPLCKIEKAPQGHCLINRNGPMVETLKKELREKPHHHLPAFPVMVMNPDWKTEDIEDTSFYLLGGCSLWEAIVDLADEQRFAHYRNCMVNVHAGLSEVEALEVGAVFQQHQTLVKDEIPDLETKVKMCRRLLYRMHNLDEDVDEPPSKVKDDWRKQAAAALGSMISPLHDGRKPLEPLFQLALYSRRCYAKLCRLFQIHLANTGKPLKISVFLQLQGLAEPERFDLLTQVVGGELLLKEVKNVAQKIKHLRLVRQKMQTLTHMKTWEECVRRYPIHTQDSALEQFLGKDMRKSVPQEFLDFLMEAEETLTGECTSLEELQGNPVTVTVIEVESTKRMKTQIKKLKEGTRQLVVLADKLEVAAAWQFEMKRSGFKNMGEAVVVGDKNAQHLIVGGENENTIPKVLQGKTCMKTLLEMYSHPNDSVVCSVRNQAQFDETANLLRRISKKLWTFCGEGSEESQTSESSDDYEFLDQQQNDLVTSVGEMQES